jgi:hypothetical protein
MRKSIVAFIVCLSFATLVSAQTVVKKAEFNPEKIKSELAEKYNAYNGRVEDQTVEMWDTYFLRSPNIGNMHEGHPEIGWEAFHAGTIAFVKSNPKGELTMENLEFYPIDSNIAWVRGKMVIKTNDRVMVADFYDSLVKTVEGWRVILSVVTPERKKTEG